MQIQTNTNTHAHTHARFSFMLDRFHISSRDSRIYWCQIRILLNFGENKMYLHLFSWLNFSATIYLSIRISHCVLYTYECFRHALDAKKLSFKKLAKLGVRHAVQSFSSRSAASIVSSLITAWSGRGRVQNAVERTSRLDERISIFMKFST